MLRRLHTDVNCRPRRCQRTWQSAVWDLWWPGHQERADPLFIGIWLHC